MNTLRDGFARWRELGPRRGTAAALVRLAMPLRGRLREAWLRARPLRVSRSELELALGAQGARARLRGAVLDAMPTVRAFERELERIDAAAREQILSRAHEIAQHRFDLLGSGPSELGPRINWRQDFKSGRQWPLAYIAHVAIVYPDDSDIKVPWELSRFQQLPLLAAAHRLTGERRWLEEMGAQLTDWIEANPVEFGPNWACTMDVAIRAANWVAALALVADAAVEEPWFEAVLASLLLHGRFIRGHLEYAHVRGNHYLADVAGLLTVAVLFGAGREGSQWGRWAARELSAELAHQVRPDGCDHEASIPYHRLVTEMFICALAAAEALVPEQDFAGERAVVGRMLEFVRDYARPDMLAPQVGDADDGRFLPLGEYGSQEHRSHLHLFAQAGIEYHPATESAAYPRGGYWMVRAGEIYLLIRCGDVGLGGMGAHAHNDALAFELALGAQPLVVDPGSYLYTADLTERARFRSTAFHSTLQIDGAEQNAIDPELPFAMADRRAAEMLSWAPSTSGALFVGRHEGYRALPAPATHTRSFELDAPARELRIIDAVSSEAAHDLRWTFPLAGGEVQIAGPVVRASFGGAALEIEAPSVEFEVEPGWYSPSYGRRLEVPFVRARRRSQPGEDVTRFVLRLSGPASAPA